MNATALQNAISSVPPGPWAVGVSGGADSVALLLLLRARADLQLHVAHLDHQTRDGESGVDAEFIATLAKRMCLPVSIGLRSETEATMPRVSANVSDRYRQARLTFFQGVVVRENLHGVILAHHADDQAETIAMRLLRQASMTNLRSIQPESIVNNLKILRPMLDIPAVDLRTFLQQQNQSWREDASNQSDKYQRNRIRRWIAGQERLRKELIELGRISDALRSLLDSKAPALGDRFRIGDVASLPRAIARHSVARWLVDRGVPVVQINMATCDRLVEMASDAASPPRQHFPGGLLVRRKQGMIFVDDPPKPAGEK